jgi:thymidylate synthase (FAD)
MEQQPAPESQSSDTVQVLDHGFVRLVDCMGSDSRIAEAARVSYKGGKQVRDDAALIDYLMRHEHMGPFEQVVFVFHIRLPIYVMRQIVRHRTARINEISGRYVTLEDEFNVPDSVRGPDPMNKQGSIEYPVTDPLHAFARGMIQNASTKAYEYYKVLQNSGVANELARLVLPVNIYTECYFQIDLRNLMNLLKLRLDPHAQAEIRKYAAAMAHFVAQKTPIALAAFERNIRKAVKFTADELTILRGLLHKQIPDQMKGIIKVAKPGWSDARVQELVNKISQIVESEN